MTDPVPPSWERSVLERVALKALEEQRRARQWSALFKLLWFLVAFLILSSWFGWIGRPDRDALSSGAGRHMGAGFAPFVLWLVVCDVLIPVSWSDSLPKFHGVRIA